MAKKIFVIITIVLATAILSLGALAFSINNFVKNCTQNSDFESLTYCVETASRFQPEIDFVAKVSGNKNWELYASMLKVAGRLIEHRQTFLGLQTLAPTTYMILFQNDYELRANGGFTGSYGVASVKDGNIDFKFQDIYVPDGQIPGHVDPPLPIQEAFKQGFWKLRDADWYPDFPTSAENIRWFMTEGRETDPDFLLTLNFKTVEDVIKILGPIEVPEYNVKLSPQNFYQVLQSQAETNFFPGSTQKRDTLAAVGKAFMQKLQNTTTEQKREIAYLLFSQLKNQNILVHAKDPKLQDIFEQLHFNGSLHYNTCGNKCLSDHLSIIITNLGANKANCCTQSSTIHKISRVSNQLKHEIQIQYTNTSRIENPSPPDFFGGNFISFIRFYLPPDATFIDIQTTPTHPTNTPLYPIPYEDQKPSTLIQTTRFGFKEVGFFHTTKAETSSKINLTYFLPIQDQTHLELNLQKQNGVISSPTSVILFGKNHLTNLESNFSQKSKIPTL